MHVNIKGTFALIVYFISSAQTLFMDKKKTIKYNLGINYNFALLEHFQFLYTALLSR